jgi:hypothetical protein
MEVKALAMSKVLAAIKRGEAWAVCFFLKCKAGWRETQALAHQMLDENGNPTRKLEIKVTRIEGRTRWQRSPGAPLAQNVRTLKI